MKRVMSFLLAFAVIFVGLFSVNTYATAFGISGDTNSVTFTVTTKTNDRRLGNPYIILKQKKGTYTYKGLWGKKKTKTVYGYYRVTMKPLSGRAKKTVSGTFKGSKVRLKMTRDTVYQVTVNYSFVDTWKRTGCTMYGQEWKTKPSWWVAGSYKISSIN